MNESWLSCCAHLFSPQFWAVEAGEDWEPLLEPDGPIDQPSDSAAKLKAFGIGHVLGTGAFSTVREGTHRASGRRYALKLVDKKKSDEAAVAHEVGLMRRCGAHPHLVRLFDHFELARAWVLVLELVSGGEVFERICSRGPYSERDASLLLRQVAATLQHLHSRGLAHRDVKPENLLLADRSEHALVKLCDFGLATPLDPTTGLQEEVRLLQGTVAYMAPEYLREEPHGAAVDLWALGVVLYILLSGKHPFDLDGQTEDPELAQRIRQGEWAFGSAPCWRHVSEDARSAVRLLLEPLAARRPTASALLEQPWLQGAAPTAQLPGSHTNLRAFNQARRLFRKARREAVTSVALRLLPLPPPRPPSAQRCAVHSGVADLSRGATSRAASRGGGRM